MLKLIIKYLSQAIIVFTPLLTLKYSLLDFFGFKDNTLELNLILYKFSGTKDEVELIIRLALVTLALLLMIMYDIIDYYLPQRRFKAFSQLYINNIIEEWREGIPGNIRDGIRINIMFVYRPFLFPLVRLFRWYKSYGYDPQANPDGPLAPSDMNLSLMSFQGLCGEALRKRVSRFSKVEDLNNLQWYQKCIPCLNQFNLFYWQLLKTKFVKAILSVPICIDSDENNGNWKVVGIINVDTLTDEGVKYLENNKKRFSEYFLNYGKLIAWFKNL